ncbi:MAG: hypothetical protein JXR19_06665 [Bacteroidia bacterium]
MHPFIEELYQTLDSTSVLLIGVNPYDQEKNIHSYFNRKGYKTPQLDVSKGLLPNMYEEFPTIAIVDSELNVVKLFTGYRGRHTENEIRRSLQELGIQ